MRNRSVLLKFLLGIVVIDGEELIDQVSLRGKSAKEITRDALLQKVSQERELRQHARRAAAAAIFIQVAFSVICAFGF